MIPSSPGLKTLLLLVSAALHGAVLASFFGSTEVEIAGGGGAVIEARLGNSFADLVEGVNAPTVPETPLAEPVEATPPEPAPKATPVAPQALAPQRMASAPVTPAPPVAAPALSQSAPTSAEALPPVPVDPVPGPQALAVAPSVAPEPVSEPKRIETPAARAAETPPETASAESPVPEILIASEDRAVQKSPRPTARPERRKPDPATVPQKATPKKSAPKKKTAQKPQAQPRKQGNSKSDAVAGNATGSRMSKAKAVSTKKGKGGGSGNAAASNYPGKVFKKIQRVRKPRVGGRGKVVIRFSVTASGRLKSIGISRSSGAAKLDRAAMKMVRKAAPFPKPPAGARRTFQIPIEFRR